MAKSYRVPGCGKAATEVGRVLVLGVRRNVQNFPHFLKAGDLPLSEPDLPPSRLFNFEFESLEINFRAVELYYEDGFSPSNEYLPAQWLSEKTGIHGGRFRKTKCDAKKPQCTFCTNLAIECIYQKIAPEPRSRASRSPRARRIQLPITPEGDATGGASSPNDYSSHYSSNFTITSVSSVSSESPPTGDTAHNFGSVNLLVQPALRDPAGNYTVPPSFDVPRVHQIHLPELKNVRCIAPLNELEYDDAEGYLKREIQQGYEFYAFVPTIEADLSPRPCWLLLQTFTTKILPWLPLFLADRCVKHLEDATMNNYDLANTSSTLTLFVLAIGSLLNQPNDSEDAVDRLGGMEYFYRGLEGLRVYNKTKSYDIVLIQCRILSSIYLCICLRPLQAWNAISEASNAVMVLLKMKDTLARDENLVQAVRRAYWCCYIIEAELLNIVSFQTKDLLELHDKIPLPFTDPSEPGSFYFLSEISMRKLFAGLLETIGYQSGANTHRPVVANEHQDQLASWYDNLASGLKFPLGPEPVLDPHKAFLKGQYHCMKMIANWSFVVRLITNEPMDDERRAYITKHGKECMESMYLYVHAVERMMMFRQVMLFANLYGLYCLVLGLLVTYKVPELSDIQVPNVEIAIIRGYRAMKTWGKNPSIGLCVRRCEDMMHRLNIPLEEPTPFMASR